MLLQLPALQFEMVPILEPSAQSALDCFEGLGFRVEVIAPGDVPRADLRAWKGEEEYLVEAKGREPTAASRRLLEEAAANGTATIARDFESSNAASKRLIRAAQQLASTPAGEGAYRLIWVYAGHDDERFELDCVARRLHGLAELAIIDPVKLSASTKPCYYYLGNDFRRMPEVHGAVLCGRSGFRLLINSFCPEREAFRKSSFCERLTKANAVEDPETLEAHGEAFLIGNDYQSNGTESAVGIHKSEVWSYNQQDAGSSVPRIGDASCEASEVKVPVSSVSASAFADDSAEEPPSSAVSVDVALAALGTTQQNASRWADHIEHAYQGW